MKKTILLTVILVAAFYFVKPFQSSAVTSPVKPSDYGLKEGDLISAIFSDDPDVYIINENGYKRLFLNPEIFKFYSHLGGFANIKLVTPEIRDSFPTSGFFRNCEDKDQKVFGTSVEGEDRGRLHWINKPGDQAIQEDPEFFKKVFCINRREFNWYPRGTEFKALREVPEYVRKADATPYVICHHPIDDPKSFQTIRVATEALYVHFEHGDTKGACPTYVLPTPPIPTPPIPTPFPTPTCAPRPACLDTEPRCLLPEPIGGWCPSFTPTPTITPIPFPTPTTYINVLSPNGGEVWLKGATQLVKWASSGISKIYVKLKKGNDTYSGPEGMIMDIIPNNGYLYWKPPITLPDGNDYYIRVIDANFTGILDDSDRPFSLVSGASISYSPTPTPSGYAYDLAIIDIVPTPLLPEAGKDFVVDVTIKNVGQKTISQPTIALLIYNSSGFKVYDVATSYTEGPLAPGAIGFVRFHSDLFSPRLSTATLNLPSGTYKMVASVNYLGTVDGISYQKDPNPSNDILNKTLEIKPSAVYSPTPTPTTTILPKNQMIRVTSPNGGEQWSIGNKYTITWENPGNVKGIYVDLYKAGQYLSGLGGFGYTYGAPTSWVWDTTDTPNFTAGSDFKMRVKSDTDQSIYDESDNYFSVSGPSYPVTCTSLKTNSATSRYFDACSGYDAVCFNKNYGTYQGCTNYSYDGCTTYNTNASQNMTCSVSSTIPSPTPTPAPSLTPTPTPTTSASVTVISPNGGECRAGIIPISWLSPLGTEVAYWDLNYSLNNGSAYSYLQWLHGYSWRSYNWATPDNINTGQALIKVQARGPTAPNGTLLATDVSDSTFTIATTCPGGTTPVAPSNLVATPKTYSNGTQAITLNWTDNSSNELGFATYKRAAGTSQWSGPGITAGTGMEYQGLQSGTTYEFKVRSGNQYGYSADSDIAFATVSSGSVSGESIMKPVIARDLYVGISGGDVKELQALLVNEVGFPSDLLTGYFGAITQNAVKVLQRKYGVSPVSGYFGRLTRQALGALISGQ